MSAQETAPGVAVTPPISGCRSCGAATFFARTAKGKLMPIDEKPRADGTLFVWSDHDGTLRCAVSTHELPRFTSHFATCPEAGKWRKK